MEKIKYSKDHWSATSSGPRISVAVFDERDSASISVVCAAGNMRAYLTSRELVELADTCLAAANAIEGET